MSKVKMISVMSVLIAVFFLSTGFAFAEDWYYDATSDDITTQSAKVGIGTDTPAGNLVVADVSFPSFYLQSPVTDYSTTDGLCFFIWGSAAFMTNYENAPLYFGANEVPGQMCLSNGKLGIGMGIGQEPIGKVTAIATGDQPCFLGSNGYDFAALSTEDLELGHYDSTAGSYTTRMMISTSGNVGIGTSVTPYLLSVDGTIGAREVIVTQETWADFVFKENYSLPSLDKVESFIKENKHLPDIPSEKEIKENGLSMASMMAKHMQKIEELTLYLIEHKKKNESLETYNKNLEARLEVLEKRLN